MTISVLQNVKKALEQAIQDKKDEQYVTVEDQAALPIAEKVNV